MVVFTCGHCGESVQKPKVEKHYLTQCRNRNPNLSCMDCFKDFLGQDYEAHIKCVTEEERYSGKGFVSKEKKGEKKQNAWVEMLQSVLDEQKTASHNVLRIIETISKHNNTPRKKPKFINFVKNVCGHKTNAKDIDQAWDLISIKLSALSTNGNQNNNQNKAKDTSDTANGDTNEITNGKIEKNGIKKKEKLQNGEAAHENEESDLKNGQSQEKNGNTEITNSENDEKENVEAQKADDKKLTKKQRKEEKKRLKYEAELQKAEAPPAAEEVEEDSQTISKKGKKKKNRTESGNNDDESSQAESKKQKKRKRQDTTGSAVEVVVNTSENDAPVVNEKTQKKKLKVVEQQAENSGQSICLHDQNVAKGEKIDEGGAKSDNFDWHAAIMAVLQKKGEEMQFKRLQKKVLSEYSEMTGRDVDDRIADKFIKKLRSAPRVVVDKNRVYLEE